MRAPQQEIHCMSVPSLRKCPVISTRKASRTSRFWCANNDHAARHAPRTCHEPNPSEHQRSGGQKFIIRNAVSSKVSAQPPRCTPARMAPSQFATTYKGSSTACFAGACTRPACAQARTTGLFNNTCKPSNPRIAATNLMLETQAMAERPLSDNPGRRR